MDDRGCVRRRRRRCVDRHRLEFEPTTGVEDEAEDDDRKHGDGDHVEAARSEITTFFFHFV